MENNKFIFLWTLLAIIFDDEKCENGFLHQTILKSNSIFNKLTQFDIL